MVSLREKAVNRILLSIPHVFVLQGQLTAYRETHGDFTNKVYFRLKVRRKIREERMFARKIGANYRSKRTTARKFTLTKTIGIRKLRRIFFELLRRKKFDVFCRKAPKFANFLELRSHYFCTILYYTLNNFLCI